MKNTMLMLASSSAMALAMTAYGYSADFVERFDGAKPAVSGLNGKVDFGYLFIDIPDLDASADGFYGIGSVSAPVGERFGAQIDAGLFEAEDNDGAGIDSAGIGGHFFWRNPDQALIGAYVHYVNVDAEGIPEFDIYRYGVEAELYLDRVTLSGFAGADTVDLVSGDETYAKLDFTASYYVTDNVKISAGIDHGFDSTAGVIGAEAMLPFASNNVSLYTKATFTDDTTSVNAGLRIHFGAPGKSLIARHREDDPESMLFDFAEGSALPDGVFVPGASTPPITVD
ncbi:hypothetical protein E2A64_02170 [Pseudohoeflea suaedae]|uniref:Porin n=1 Tax=Pseudohoeflea suaedae TaxID=877384 RepID=A0A4R5PLX7_9HYPH|nr:hypothetical protein [Pseudohoeflea suaedae]TDH37962.1 hypothetical protein E2A64_02170 [Pseudohoeflea suaedae]